MKILRALPGNESIPPDFPVLVSESMSIVESVFAWLIELATVPGRSHAVDTIRTYCEHLYDWFDTLEKSNIDWVAVGEKEVAAWRNRMLAQPSPHTKRPYARSTVNDRVRSVCRFYVWAHMRGLVATLPFHYVDVHVPARRSSFLAHIYPAPKVVKANVLTVSEHERLPRALGVIELRRFFAHLEMPYRLMVEWALTTGMRRKELCGLSTFQVPETAHLEADEHPLIGIPITITKGDYPRTVYPPIRLIDRTHHYIDEIRAPLVRRLRREKGRLSTVVNAVPEQLWPSCQPGTADSSIRLGVRGRRRRRYRPLVAPYLCIDDVEAAPGPDAGNPGHQSAKNSSDHVGTQFNP